MATTSLLVLLKAYPVWFGLMELLKPSEIMDFCIATRVYLHSEDKQRFMNPLREVFYSLSWIDDLVSEGGEIALLGTDISKLSNSRCTNICIGILSYKVVLCNDIPASNKDDDTSERSAHLRTMCTARFIRPEVSITPFSAPDSDVIGGNRRLTTYLYVMDNIRSFTLSINLLLDLINMTSNVRNFKYVSRIDNIAVELPYLLYSSYFGPRDKLIKRTLKGVQTLTLTKTYSRRCRCNATLYTLVRINEPSWPAHGLIGMLDINWRLWKVEPTCSRHCNEILRISNHGKSDMLYTF